MNAILTIIIEKGLTWLASFLMSYFKFENKLKKVRSKHKKEADLVDQLRAEIDYKLKKKLPISEGEWKQFRDAVYTLNSNFY